MSDTPTTNWCTWNPLKLGPSATLSDGNLYFTFASADHRLATSTFAVSSGKWYWEGTYGAGGTAGSSGFGIAKDPMDLSGSVAQSNVYAYHSNGDKYLNGTGSSYGATYTTNDIIGIAFDADDGTLTGYKNGVSQGTITTGLTSGPYFVVASSYNNSTWTLNAGQRAFAYTPPTGYKALNTANLPEPTIKDGGKYFNTVLYTGTNATLAVSGVGFQPDLVWTKARSQSDQHVLCDAVRGASNRLFSNLTNAEAANGLVSFDSDGFTLGDASTSQSMNNSGQTYVAWNWDAGGTGSSNNAGTITSTVSANASAGFSIATYSANNTAGATFGHGLGVAPSMVIIKKRNAAERWVVYHQSISNQYIYLNETFAGETANAALRFGNDSSVVAPSSTLVTIGTSNDVNGASGTYVAYCFSEVAGYSKFGSYVGNGSTTDGPFIWCGFTPRWILIKWYKDVSSAESWHIYDTARQTYNANNTILQPDSSGAEETPSDRYIDILSNGFKLRQNGQQINRSGASYIFAAFAELPFKYSTAR
jgi:hypothetical protein